MSILDNELVRKYFCFFGEGVTMAERVLAAMQEPIRMGDKYLTIHHGLGVEEVANLNGSILQPFHPLYLRLPDRFQVAEKKDPEEMIEKWKHDAWMREALMRRGAAKFNPLHQGPHTRPEADPVEEKIKETADSYGQGYEKKLEIHLRELVDLARKSHVCNKCRDRLINFLNRCIDGVGMQNPKSRFQSDE